MVRQYFRYMAPFVLFIAFLLDGQLSTLLTNWFPERAAVTCHLLLLAGIFLVRSLPLSYGMVSFTLFGLLYDVYYLGIIGLATTLYPLMFYFIYYFYQSLPLKRITNLIVFTVLVFTFEFLSFLLARLFQMTNLSMFIFVFYNLLPSLLFNFFFLLLFQPLLEKCFGNTCKT